MHIQAVFAAANPRGTPQLQLDAEVRRIESQIALSSYAQVLVGTADRPPPIFLRAVWAAQLSDLVRNITAFKPAVVQFSGHGEGVPGIMMMGENGSDQLVSGKVLAQVLGEFAATTRLVILNACYSAEQASAIREVIDCVIGMNDEIRDTAAALFSSSLYGQLAQGNSVGSAFRLAVAVMAAQYPENAHKPCLSCRPGIQADEVFLAAKSTVIPPEPEWKTLLAARSPLLPALRRAINLALPLDADLDAFVQGHQHDPRYVRVRREWGTDMQRQRKLTLLFDYGPPPEELKAHLLAYLS